MTTTIKTSEETEREREIEREIERDAIIIINTLEQLHNFPTAESLPHFVQSVSTFINGASHVCIPV